MCLVHVLLHFSWSSFALVSSSLSLRSCFKALLSLVLTPSSTFASSAIPSDIAKTSDFLFELSLQLLIQVLFFSFTSTRVSSTLWEISFHFTRGFGFFHLSCELCHPSSTGERCQLAFECQSLDDHPALFFDMAFYKNCNVFPDFRCWFSFWRRRRW